MKAIVYVEARITFIRDRSRPVRQCRWNAGWGMADVLRVSCISAAGGVRGPDFQAMRPTQKL